MKNDQAIPLASAIAPGVTAATDAGDEFTLSSEWRIDKIKVNGHIDGVVGSL